MLPATPSQSQTTAKIALDQQLQIPRTADKTILCPKLLATQIKAKAHSPPKVILRKLV